MRVPSLVAAFAIVCGCAPMRNFVYGPTPPMKRADAPGQIDGHAAMTYPVPVEDPRGDVQLAAERLATVSEPDGRHWHKTRVLVVRMVVRNRDTEVWSIDTSALDAVLGGSRHEYPIRAYADGQPLWVLVIEPGETRSIDLYYELPAKVARPALGVEWRVLTPTGSITRRTVSFARHEAPRPPDAPPPATGPAQASGATTGRAAELIDAGAR
jgi:hypothetical protein